MKNLNFKHLVLTVGTSPLPVYISARYLLKNNPALQFVYLISSEENQDHNQRGTWDYAEKLQNELKGYTEAKIITDNLYISDAVNPVCIGNTVKDYILDKVQKGDSIHIDYTGGTKAMTVHTYKTLMFSDASKLNKIDVTGSYLDAKRSIMVFDNGEQSEDLRGQEFFDNDKNAISLIAGLHGINIKNPSICNPVFDEAIEKFEELIEHEKLDNFYGPGGYKRKYYYGKNDSISETFRGVNDKDAMKKFYTDKDNKPNEAFLKIMRSVPEEYRFINYDDVSGIVSLREDIKDDFFKDLIKDFIDGKWLEMYVYRTLKEDLLPQYPDYRLYYDFIGYKPVWGENDFQIDIMILNGYEIIGISITTSGKKSICKSKGFEIMVRSQQLGGAEAKFILITRADENTVKQISDELAIDTGRSKSNILVLGKKQINRQKLVEEIENFLL